EESNLIDIVEDSIDASPISGSHEGLVTETIEETNLIDIVEDSIDASPISGSHEGLVTETIEDTNLTKAIIKDTIVKEPKGTQANQSMELPKTGEVNSVLSILLGMFTIAISGMLYKKKD
ncbi:LPXTG cell wall anchor domain-containing protein, partial [Streptococcus phocae]